MADISGYGVLLQIGTAVTSVTSGTSIGKITNISGPNMTKGSIPAGSADSTSQFIDFLPGMIDAGEMTVDVKYDGTSSGNANNLSTIFAGTGTYAIKIAVNDHTTPTSKSNWVCVGFLTALGHAIPYDGLVTQSIGIKLSGVPTYTDLAA